MCYFTSQHFQRPPDGEMARSCLKAYGGNYVAIVGEVDGDTASRGVLGMLRKDFALVASIQLPQFDDTAYRLYVWERSTEAAKPIAYCSQCGASDVPLRRCVLCRCAAYCSEACCKRNRAAHERLHRGRHVRLPSTPRFDDGNAYQALVLE